MLSREQLLDARPAQLRDWLWQGSPLLVDDIVGYSYRGISLGIPSLVERFTWKTFRKTFLVRPDGTTGGFNTRLEQTGIEGPIKPRQRRGTPHIFGHFDIRPAADSEAPRDTLVLDYSVPENARSILGRLRDPLVALSPGDPTRLLGCTLLQFAGRAIPTPSFFLLEREE